jgi:tRNA A-37 threonylcarbamoyl transferase component Bud32
MSRDGQTLAQIHDVGENYIVMDSVEGYPVKASNNTRKLLDIAAQFAEGLAATHIAGFVHEDSRLWAN